MSDIQITGLAELNALLQTLPKKVEAKILRQGLRAGQKEILEAAKSRVPVASGALRASLKIKTSSKRGVVSARLVAGSKTAYYAHMVEFGTAAHKITAKNGGMLNFGGRLVKSVDHPGARKRPFMRPAIDHKQGDAVEAMRAYIEARTPREIEKLKAGR